MLVISDHGLMQEVLPDEKNKDSYEEAFRRHDEISKGLFDKGGVAYL